MKQTFVTITLFNRVAQKCFEKKTIIEELLQDFEVSGWEGGVTYLTLKLKIEDFILFHNEKYLTLGMSLKKG